MKIITTVLDSQPTTLTGSNKIPTATTTTPATAVVPRGAKSLRIDVIDSGVGVSKVRWLIDILNLNKIGIFDYFKMFNF